MDTLWLTLSCMCAVCFPLKIFAFPDIITTSQPLKDGDTLISNGGSFQLGFFSPGNSKGRYLGIWYNNIPVRTIVWVANRGNPIGDLSGSLVINGTGNLALSNGTNGVAWSAVSFKAARNPVAQLLDTGNLVIRDNNSGNSDIYLWQSFDYPCDTLLPGMKLGWDLRTSFNRRLSSWKNPDDPSPGELTMGIELDAYPQKVSWKNTRKIFRGGPWNGLRFSGAPELKINPLFDFRFVSNEEEVYYVYDLVNKSVISRLVLNESTSTHQRYVWVDSDQSWSLYASVPRDYCDNYGLCGANGFCVITDSPVCQCLEGFKPKSAQSWNSMDWLSGCIRTEPLNCSKKHDFVKFSHLKVPDTKYSWVNESMSLRECKETCLKNGSCMAYSNINVSEGGSGCALWFGDLVDMRQFSDGGQDLYIRMMASNPTKRSLVIAVPILVALALICGLLILICYIHKRLTKAKGVKAAYNVAKKENLDLPFLKLTTVSQATDNFSVNRKLGEGGFGPVYKGLMKDGQEIAVKRQSNCYGQGVIEFKNEVKLIAKLQHRNLVKLLSCCIEGDEKILIYEYMPNGSLDMFLFDDTRRSRLDWSKRFNIICGIARGLLYLHQDSILRIIHRDLKASNILLDNELNPKISDFGLARLFGGDQIENKTKRIVGTYGYMAPEYAVFGSFSVKSDVFSFGIVLLEIVSGTKNIGLDHSQNHHNLIGYVWESWTDGKPIEVIDPVLQNPSNPLEMIRCIHVALLCLQQNPDDRPTMSTVVLMLNGESILPEPKQPGFLIDLIPSRLSSLSNSKTAFSANDITISLVEAR